MLQSFITIVSFIVFIIIPTFCIGYGIGKVGFDNIWD